MKPIYLPVIALVSLLSAPAAHADVVLGDWNGPPRLGILPSQPAVMQPIQSGPTGAQTDFVTFSEPTIDAGGPAPGGEERPPSSEANSPSGSGATDTVNPILPAVPETSTWVMMILGFFGLAFLARRRRMVSRLA